ncbi:hypothetical protein ACS0TY_021009 [Phlomoides rotata]
MGSFLPNHRNICSRHWWVDAHLQLTHIHAHGRISSPRKSIKLDPLKSQEVGINISCWLCMLYIFALNEKGAFVREILVEELAKGLDALGLATLESITSAMIANLPFRPNPISSMTDDDITNLRTLRHLVLLLSGPQQTETSASVNFP